MHKLKNVVVIIAAFVFGLLGAVAGNLVWAHEGDTSLIHGCVASAGALRIVSANSTCRSNETPLDWRIGGSGGGISGLEVVWNTSTERIDGGVIGTVNCPPGKKVLGGGVGGGQDTWVYQNRPAGPDITKPSGSSTNPTGWHAFAGNAAQEVTVYAICANASP